MTGALACAALLAVFYFISFGITRLLLRNTTWDEYSLDAPWQAAGAYPGPYATPTWHAGRVYYSSPHGTVGCLDAATGDAVWSVNVVREYHSRVFTNG